MLEFCKIESLRKCEVHRYMCIYAVNDNMYTYNPVDDVMCGFGVLCMM